MELLENILWAFTHLKEFLTRLVEWSPPGTYLVLFLIIFCETGLVVTPFLPGDSLLFALGALASLPESQLSLPLLIALLTLAAVVGDGVNYAIGYRLGPKVFRYENSWLLNKKHLIRAQEFYERYGSKTIVLARFVPIVRTFAPFVAGIGKMNYFRFALYNVAGGLLWVLICVLGGVFFGTLPWVEKNFELVLVAVVVISVLPMVIEFLLRLRKQPARPPHPARPPVEPVPELAEEP
jgi:membrane-associated protein